MNICTIIAKNYLPYARVLARSHAEHHPQSQCFVLIIDAADGDVDAAQEPFEVLTIGDIGLDEFDEMRATYDILELSTAVKPWARIASSFSTKAAAWDTASATPFSTIASQR